VKPDEEAQPTRRTDRGSVTGQKHRISEQGRQGFERFPAIAPFAYLGLGCHGQERYFATPDAVRPGPNLLGFSSRDPISMVLTQQFRSDGSLQEAPRCRGGGSTNPPGRIVIASYPQARQTANCLVRRRAPGSVVVVLRRVQ